tara:strand:- start:2 stop:748 length:747 start_codon:yes stop_codon:yes gene_type:complete
MKISFSTHPYLLDIKETHPVPSKTNIPQWFKNLNSYVSGTDSIEGKFTIKKCVPFLDALTCGYLLKCPLDMQINHRFEDNDGQIVSKISLCSNRAGRIIEQEGLNINFNGEEIHGKEQLEGSPFIELQKTNSFFKILNPWFIKTPPGYSCLFVPPLNRPNENFECLSGIVDTDTFKNYINFPCVFKKEGEFEIKQGDPLINVIPFKREVFNMEIKAEDKNKRNQSVFEWSLVLKEWYKKTYWHKKKWN